MLEVIAALAAAVSLKLVILIPYWLRRPKVLVCDEIDHAWNSAWVLPDMDAHNADIRRMAANTAVPELRLTNNYGLVSYIDSNGVMRTEQGMYDPFAGQVRGVSNETPVVGGPVVGKVIPLFGRTVGEQ